MKGLNLRNHFQPVHARHSQVQQNDVGQKFFCKFHSLYAVADVRHDAYILLDFDDGNNAIANHRMIIRHEYFDFGLFYMVWLDGFSFSVNGTRTRIAVPPSVGLLISIWPPMRCALSRMVESP